MHLTELLIIGYGGDEAVFAVTLTPHHADLVLTATNDNDETVVDSTRRQATDIFDKIQQLLERVVGAAAVV